MAKDRLEQYMDTMREAVEKMKERPAVKEFLALQEMVNAAEQLNKAILAMEEEVPTITAPKERKPRTRKEAKMPVLSSDTFPNGETTATGMVGEVRESNGVTVDMSA